MDTSCLLLNALNIFKRMAIKTVCIWFIEEVENGPLNSAD
jgi:hypothetical protein